MQVSAKALLKGRHYYLNNEFYPHVGEKVRLRGICRDADVPQKNKYLVMLDDNGNEYLLHIDSFVYDSPITA